MPTPADIRRELSSAVLVSQGQAEADGHRTYRVRMVVPPASQSWFPGDDVELYVDTSTYQLVRTTISHQGTLLDTDDLTWTPKATANLSLTRLTVPAGFTNGLPQPRRTWSPSAGPAAARASEAARAGAVMWPAVFGGG